jgi:type I restriction enzyme S subunit
VTAAPSWLADIPSHWTLKPLGFAVTVVGGATPSKENPDFWDGTVPWVSPKDMKSFDLNDSEDHITESALDGSSLILVKPAAVLMVIRGMILVHTVPVAVNRVPVTLNQDMKALVTGPDYSARFLAYLLRAANPAMLAMVEEAGHGTRCLRTEVWMKLRLPVPPRSEQERITVVLDRRCADLDAVIGAKHRMLGQLREKRQALVTRLVTRGLDPGARLTDSGIECLGKVPEHWSVERLKYRFRRIEQGWSPQCDSRPADPGEWGVLKVGCMNSGTYDESENKALPSDLEPAPELEVRPGDVLMSRSNTLELVGMVGVVHQTQGRILLCDKLYRIDFDTARSDPLFAVFLLRSQVARLQIERDASGASSSMKNISTEGVGNMVFAFPPVEEQRRIAARVIEVVSHGEATVARIEEQLVKLREYRQALITAAVTGKLDVRRKAAL